MPVKAAAASGRYTLGLLPHVLTVLTPMSAAMGHVTWLDHALVGLLIVVGLYAVLVGQRQMKTVVIDRDVRVSAYWSNGAILWVGGALTCAVWVLGDRPLAGLGLVLEQESVGVGSVITVGFCAWFGLLSWREIATAERRALTRARWQRDVPILPKSPGELPHFSFLAVAAGVNEEIIARGFLISYAIGLFGTSTTDLIAAVALPAAAFAVAHLYQGWKAVGRIVVLASAFGAIFVITGSLLIPAVLHVIIDVAGGYLAMRIHAEGESAARTADVI
jgi:hypothetical protein